MTQRKFKNGDAFHRLTVVGYNSAKSLYICECACGKRTEASTFALTSGKRKSCGKGLCHYSTKNLTNHRFGHLVAIRIVPNSSSRRVLWECLCDCGNTHKATARVLLRGSTRSCGCQRDSLFSAKRTLPNNQRVVNHILTGYTAHAVKLGVPFLLSMEAFRTLLAGSCHYCGSAPTNLRREKNLDPSKREFAYNGIDRIDNSAGYYSGNCVSCCRNCNYAKRKLSYDDFISLAKNIAARFSRDTDAIKILDATKRIYIASTGAGAGLQSLLWSVPGISKVLIGASFPYAEEATNHFLGFKPESYCSKHTAICMALEAYYRAIQTGNALAVGLGLTASVASRESHRGDHRVFISTVTNNGCWIYTATLVKGSGPEARKRDGDTCDTLGMAALLEAVGLEDTTNIEPSLLSFEKRECTKEAMDVLLEYPLFTASGKRQKAPSNGNGVVLFPGAFNPPHEGHYWMAREHQATFHITRDTPHKPTLGIAEVLQRAKLLEGYNRLFTTGDPLYIDKARRFPGSTILVGVDAIQRMLDPNWGPDVPEMLNTFRSLGIRFLVADRMLDGKLITLDDITGAPKDICQRILRPAQHLAMSSTKIREAVNA